MRKYTKVSENRWRSVDGLLRRWLAERQELLSLYCNLSNSAKSGTASALQRLDRFCEILVDYVSAGHFEVYCELFEEGERSGKKRHPIITELYALIVPSTAVALDFNDRYLNAGRREDLKKDLSLLGQMLASRFDWEDALIHHLHRPQRAVA